MTKKRLSVVLLIGAGLLLGWWNYSIGPLPLAREVRNSAGRFRLAPSIPGPRSESGGAVWNDRLYLVGGIGAWAQTLTSFVVYEPSRESWSALPDLPQPINHPGVVASDDKIFVIGGFGPLGIRLRGFMFALWRPLDTVHIFDIRRSRWTEGPRMPAPRGAGGVAVAEGMIWYVGGIDETLSINADLSRLDPAGGGWQKIGAMPTARDHLRLEAVGARLYAISGRQDDLRRNLSIMERYDIRSSRWERVADIPEGRGGMGSVAKDGFIYTFGGEQVWTCLDRIDRYDVRNDRWQALGRLPEGRHGIVAGVMRDRIHLVSGGRHPRVSVSGIHRVYEPD